MKNILVTGAGALLGQGILRMLQLCNFPKKIFTADPDPRSAGHWLGDLALTVPKANEAGYIDAIEALVKEYNIDAILVGTDTELVKFAEYSSYFLDKFNCKVIVSSPEVIGISNDKFETAEFLKRNGFPYPVSTMANSIENLVNLKKKLGFPLFAKPVDGARSMGLITIHNHEELMDVYHPDSNLVVQQYLSADEGEYTSGCIVLDGKCVAIVTLRRDLRDGNTYRTYRDAATSSYDHLIKEIAEKLNPEGPVNFQFRIADGKPVIFEINGRFSGTTPLRYFYGLNEVEMILNHYLYGIQMPVPDLRNGIVLRAWSDIFIEHEYVDQLRDEKSLETPQVEFFNFNLKG